MFKSQVEFRFLQIASGAFLGNELPDNWESLVDEEKEEYLTDEVCGFVEFGNVAALWDNIDNLGDAIQKAAEDYHAEQTMLCQVVIPGSF